VAHCASWLEPHESLDGEDESRANEILWLSDGDLKQRIRHLRNDRGASGRSVGDPGQFTLAGAQPKMAALERDGIFGIPGVSLSTTTIFEARHARAD